MRSRLRHLPSALIASGVALLLAVVVGWVIVGPAGGLGAGLGVALVAASYVASTLAIAWADSVKPQLVFGVGMGMYVTKFSLFGLLVLAAGQSDWPGLVPFALGIVAGVFAWTGSQIWWTTRHARPAAPPGGPESGGPESGGPESAGPESAGPAAGGWTGVDQRPTN